MGIIKKENILPEIKDIIFQLIQEGISASRAAIREVTLATHKQKEINLRTVILRKFEEENQKLIIYTDYRSNKIKEIQTNENVAVLLYDRANKCQIKIKGKAIVHHQDAIAKSHWEELKGGKSSYLTNKAPGTSVNSLERAHVYLDETEDTHFSVIEIQNEEMEVLQLKSKEHIRAKFYLTENKSEWLVP